MLAAYTFLVHHYQAGDHIDLFGFTRGAYTVRVLAGLIHKVGLLTPEQGNLADSGLIAYKQVSSDEAPKLRATIKSAIDDAAAEDTLPQTAMTTPHNSRGLPRRAGRPSVLSASGTPSRV